MSETETRDAAELTADEWVDAFLGQPRFVQVELAERIIAESRAVTDLAALRSAVQAIADDALAAGRAPADEPCDYRDEHDCHAVARYFVAERLRGVLAEVGSSGEAESGDWMLECDVPGCGVRYAAQEDLRGTGDAGAREARRRAALDGWSFGDDDDLCPVHNPAPVSSGGQADGEGEARDLADAIIELDNMTPAQRNARVAAVRRWLGAAGYVFVPPEDARPVLSREALEGRVLTALARTEGRSLQVKADAVLDVLTAGGEQE